MCICQKKLLERVVLPPRTGVRGWVSAPNCWQVLWVTGGRATEAEEDLQKQQERLGSQSWGMACFRDTEACFSDHNSLKVSHSPPSLLLAGFDLIWENTQTDGRDGASSVLKRRKQGSPLPSEPVVPVCAFRQQVTFQWQ